MPKKDKKINVPLNIFVLSCIIYTPLTIAINLICEFASDQLLKAWANLIVYLLAFIISAVLFFRKKIICKNPIINKIACLYTLLSFTINTFVFIIYDGKMWSIESILLILAYSVIISVLLKYFKIKSYLIKTTVYYAISLAAFMVLTIAIAKYNDGNNTMILFGAFTAFYVIASILYFFVKRSFASYENEEKTYKKQFD